MGKVREATREANAAYQAILERSTWEPPTPGPVRRKRSWKHYTPAGPVTTTTRDGTVTTEPALPPREYRQVVRDRPMTEDLRRAVSRRDRGTCRYCGTYAADSYQVDHVIPVAQGGPTTLGNLVLACTTCNQTKGNKVWTPTKLRVHLAALTPDNLE